MMEAKMDYMLITTAEDFFYFTGLLSRFWHSPTRPYYLVVPRVGARPLAVVPSIMTETLVSRTWMPEANVKDWPAPRQEDDGVTTLLEMLGSLPGREFGCAGFMLGHESTMRMPIQDVDKLRAGLKVAGVHIADASRVVRQLRMHKTQFEVDRVRHACDVASAAFSALPCRVEALQKRKARCGEALVTERECRDEMRRLMLELGADDTPYVMCQSGNGGYDNIILEPTDSPLLPGDVVVIDTGACFEGYWCDFDRNFVVGGEHFLGEAARETHDKVWLATEAGFEAACRHGATSSDVYRAMAAVLGVADGSVGRYGHGLGLHITEHFSNNASDEEPLVAGMTMTLEPGMNIGDSELMIVHEENIVITETGAEWLSERAPRQMGSILTGSGAFNGMQFSTVANGIKSRL